MTCDRDCKKCSYGEVIPKKILCTNDGITCDGNCYDCGYAAVLEYESKCKKN